MKEVDIDLFKSTAELRRYTIALIEENIKLKKKREIDPHILLALQSASGILRRETFHNTADCLDLLHEVLIRERDEESNISCP